MSASIDLACRTCKRYLTIGQHPLGHPERGYVYTQPDEQKARLDGFVIEHIGHDLTIVTDERGQQVILDDGWVDAEDGFMWGRDY